MTKEEIEKKIDEYNDRIAECQARIEMSRRYYIIGYIVLAIGIGMFFGGLILTLIGATDSYKDFGWILLFVSFFVFIPALVLLIITTIRANKAPNAIDVYEKKIETLKNIIVTREENNKVLAAEKTKNSELKNMDLLLKYKQLLDQNVISQEEFDEKKKELLNL